MRIADARTRNARGDTIGTSANGRRRRDRRSRRLWRRTSCAQDGPFGGNRSPGWTSGIDRQWSVAEVRELLVEKDAEGATETTHAVEGGHTLSEGRLSAWWQGWLQGGGPAGKGAGGFVRASLVMATATAAAAAVVTAGARTGETPGWRDRAMRNSRATAPALRQWVLRSLLGGTQLPYVRDTVCPFA